MEGKGAGEREAADLDLGLDIVDGVAALDLEGDGLPSKRLHEDLHLAGPVCSRCSCVRGGGYSSGYWSGGGGGCGVFIPCRAGFLGFRPKRSEAK